MKIWDSKQSCISNGFFLLEINLSEASAHARMTRFNT